jgi:hypothetical protein
MKTTILFSLISILPATFRLRPRRGLPLIETIRRVMALRLLAVGDINGDQRQDLASANHLDHTVSVLIGNADGSFQLPRSVYLGADVGPRSVVIADFNLDGLADLAVVNATAGTLVISSGQW